MLQQLCFAKDVPSHLVHQMKILTPSSSERKGLTSHPRSSLAEGIDRSVYSSAITPVGDRTVKAMRKLDVCGSVRALCGRRGEEGEAGEGEGEVEGQGEGGEGVTQKESVC